MILEALGIPPARQAQTAARRQRQPRLPAPDPRLLPHATAHPLIQDNLSANWTPDIRAFAAANNIELVPTPTYASYLNRIECHFLPISEFVIKNADYLDWDAFAHGLARHVTYRNGEHRNLKADRPSTAPPDRRLTDAISGQDM